MKPLRVPATVRQLGCVARAFASMPSTALPPPATGPLQIVGALKAQADKVALTSRAFYNGKLLGGPFVAAEGY